MRKQLASLVVMLVIVNFCGGQTLFTYGSKAVSRDEFIRAFNKNPGLEPDRKKALKEYLDLYINFRLKVQAAYDAKLQNDPNYRFETDNFKKQLATNFINEEANINQLVQEAFQRSQKDIELKQVFAEIAGGDTLSAYNKIQKAYFDLRSGKPFMDLSRQLNPASADLGYITVFTLPYSFENAIYSLKPGEYSAPMRSASGYHIFYNASERPAVGRRKAAQILFAFPPDASPAEKASVRAKADSVRQVLLKDPAAWHEMVHAFSNDLTTADNHGEMQEFGIGQFSPAFESAAFALKHAGEISLPVETQYGFHLIKLTDIIPVPRDIDDAVVAAGFREKVERDDRLSQARKLLVDKWMKASQFKTASFNEKELWAYTDSFFAGGNTKAFKNVNDSTVIFRFAKQKITASDFAKYNRAMKAFPMYQGMTYPEILKEYQKAAATEYYQNHLEDFNPAFRFQVKEFNEANLLFAIMDQEVWTKSATDERGLRAYFEEHRDKYKWEASAQAILFTAKDAAILGQLQDKLKSDIGSWKSIAEGFENSVMADSNRFELSQIPVVDRTNFTDGLMTAPVRNNDNSFTFAYIIRVFPDASARSFEEARGLVINEYQGVLERNWIASLKKKYPVKVNQAVFNSIK